MLHRMVRLTKSRFFITPRTTPATRSAHLSTHSRLPLAAGRKEHEKLLVPGGHECVCGKRDVGATGGSPQGILGPRGGLYVEAVDRRVYRRIDAARWHTGSREYRRGRKVRVSFGTAWTAGTARRGAGGHSHLSGDRRCERPQPGARCSAAGGE